MDKFTHTSIQDYLQVKFTSTSTCKTSTCTFQQVKVYLFYFPGKVLASTFFKALVGGIGV